ncbi:CRISPR-associated helicase Cas3' [uncultured Faecalibaculum sp.]|uniref:CRISPR-associated helicase Cas3' n=1 Tax=uncultured Faecalibaculum sp. TaxID=1729681 RepID=UPI002605B254|nr:CRISPR-associated helicase Cas3' [uncultured Faecalibaculum sp.]
MDEYWGHYREEDDTVQGLIEHLENVSGLCGKFAAAFGYEELGKVAGLLHDMGKFSLQFQKRIRGEGPKVDHSTAGAKIAREEYGRALGSELITDILLGYSIVSHHSGLCDRGSITDFANAGTYEARMKKKNLPDYGAWKTEVELPELSFPKDVFQKLQSLSETDKGLYLSFLSRMIYSCLVDADFLDTEQFMSNGEIVRNGGDSLVDILHSVKNVIAQRGWLNASDRQSLNGRRREILQTCMKKGKSTDRGAFRLTVPTGGGKTVSSLMFALEHAVKNGMDRIIYVAPFTTIIEQNAQVIRELAGDQNVLEHHASFDFSASEELRNLQLASENWNIPIIITTNVRFFESFYGSKSSQCRRLHNVSNSVVIFDEVQALPNEYLKPCLETIKQLINHYGVSTVFCTATQPSLDRFLDDIMPEEICPDVLGQFEAFKRHTFQMMGKCDVNELGQKLVNEYQALCVVNTRRTAQQIYKQIGENDGVFCLSTLIAPKHRRDILTEIKSRLKRGQKCMVVSTSLVEAGVDLDFQNVYRELAGVDNILQAAGRNNREGKRLWQECKVFIFELEDGKGNGIQSRKASITKALLEQDKNIEDLETIYTYFTEIYSMEGESLDIHDICRMFDIGQEQFKTASERMRLIEEGGVDIIIPQDEIESLISKADYGLTREEFRIIENYLVHVPQNELNKLIEHGDVTAVKNIDGLYILQNSSMYSHEIGLLLNQETGEALIF